MQNCFDDLSMSQLVLNHPTWYSPCGGNSLLDLVASNLPDQIVDLRVSPKHIRSQSGNVSACKLVASPQTHLPQSYIGTSVRQNGKN